MLVSYGCALIMTKESVMAYLPLGSNGRSDYSNGVLSDVLKH